MKYSVIVLLEGRSKGFAQYIDELNAVFSEQQEPYEILIVANGIEWFLREQLERIKHKEAVRALALNSRAPQAVCIKAGFSECRGEIIVVCGSYQQLTWDSFASLPDAFEGGVDIIAPWRQNRVDPPINQFQSKVFNAIVQKVTGFKLHDLSCTVRVFRRAVLEHTVLYGNMYRFLPIVAAQKGFRYKEVKCGHQEERGEVGIYGLSAYVGRLLDILTLYFNTRFSRKPLRFFGNIGALFLGAGGVIALFVFAQKLLFGVPIGDRAILLLAVLLMVLGVQAASAGLLGEIIVFTQGRQRKEYTVEKIVS